MGKVQQQPLLVAAAVMVLVTLSTLSTLATALPSNIGQNYTSDLLRLAKAAEIKAYIGEQKDPCNNFYKFACGKWSRLHPPTDNVPRTTYLDQLHDLYVRKSADMLKGDPKLDTTVDAMLKNFYESCRNKDALQVSGVEPILRVVDFKGGWPKVTSESWYEYEYDWLKVVADLRRKLGVDILIGLEIVPDFKVKNLNRIKVGAPKLHLGGKKAYLSNEYSVRRKEYRQSIAQKLQSYFTNMSDTWAREVAAQILSVEKQLAKGLPDNDKLTLLQTSRQRNAADLKQAYGNFVDLSRYFDLIFNQTIYAQVYETPEDYMSNLVDVIKNTPKLTIANYTMWRVLENFDYAGEINRKQNTVWCVRRLMEYFPHQLENMFHRNYNNMQMVNELQSLWTDIKKTFREELQTPGKLAWISSDTRQKAIIKLEAIELEIITHEGENFDEMTHGLILRKDKYFQNLVNVLQWQTKRQLATLNEKLQSAGLQIQRPRYQLVSNKIQIPIIFLQARFFFDTEYPTALKYSTLGVLLAQEMLRGFDVTGRKYDKHGFQRNWWDTASEEEFDERASCFAKQYGSYKFHGKEISDPALLLTSIADNGGLSIAYLAYQRWWQNGGNYEVFQKETLPLLTFSRNQLFFIGAAQLHCASYNDDTLQSDAPQLFHDELPEKWRINGALTNLVEFAREFKCATGSKMNAEHKCLIY